MKKCFGIIIYIYFKEFLKREGEGGLNILCWLRWVVFRGCIFVCVVILYIWWIMNWRDKVSCVVV